MARLLEHTEIVIAHDSEDVSEDLYRFADVIAKTSFRYRWEKLDRQTTAVSNSRPDLIDSIKILVRWTEQELDDLNIKQRDEH